MPLNKCERCGQIVSAKPGAAHECAVSSAVKRPRRACDAKTALAKCARSEKEKLRKRGHNLVARAQLTRTLTRARYTACLFAGGGERHPIREGVLTVMQNGIAVYDDKDAWPCLHATLSADQTAATRGFQMLPCLSDLPGGLLIETIGLAVSGPLCRRIVREIS